MKNITTVDLVNKGFNDFVQKSNLLSNYAETKKEEIEHVKEALNNKILDGDVTTQRIE